MRLHIVIFRPILLEFCLPFFELNHYWRTNGGDWFYISSDTHTWCLYDRTLSLKCCRSWLVYHLECECAYTQRTRRRKPDWQRTMVFLTLLRTQLSLGGDAIDARCPPVERCWTEMFLSQMLRRWGMTSVERLDWVLFSAINIPLVQCWFCARIWRNMSRAASLILGRGSCGCFMNCMLSLVRRLHWCWDACFVSMRYLCLIAKLLLVTSLRPNTWEYLARRTKEMMILMRARWTRNGAVRRHCPSVSHGINASRTLDQEKWNLLFFSNFYWTGLKTCLQWIAERISSAAIIFHETRRVQTRQLEQPWWSDIF